MKITFKDVGQGDSILIEWKKGDINKIGIIDCCNKGKKNPVLLHIENYKYDVIDFIILSHPHRDHYSGLLQLLEYIEREKITVNRFSQTITHAGIAYWKYFEVSSSDSRLLKKIIKKTKNLKELGLIKKNDLLVDGKIIRIEENIELECLAPCMDDIELYLKTVKLDADKNIKEASQAANLLATVIKLKIDDNFILFTSDAECSALSGIISNYSEKFKGAKFHVCQLPHHGSEKNINENFWQIVETIDKKHAMISAGQNKKYNHPSYSVIEKFYQNGFQIHCTNIVNGMSEFTENLQAIKKASLALDGCSELAEEYMKSNDRIFELVDNQFSLV
jgi:beta-lactamase superfamily II metal-dependent hydrolase